MILGRGTAQTDAAIIAEYQQFLVANQQHPGDDRLADLQQVPVTMLQRIGKPIATWTDDDILSLYSDRCTGTGNNYTAFLKFLFFYGYRQATLHLLTTLRICFCRQHQPALLGCRHNLEQAAQDLGYAPAPGGVGQVLHLLAALLAVTSKPLSELTRADFDAFRDDYQHWYRAAKAHRGGPDSNLTRLEHYLVHWKVIAPANVVLRDEERLAQLRHAAIHDGVHYYMTWLAGKYHKTTRRHRQYAVLYFFLWLQEHEPAIDRLDAVTRTVALTYAQQLRKQVEQGVYQVQYSRELYIAMQRFYAFAITEQLASAPLQNPFLLHDLPRQPQLVPRYLNDQEIQTILRYCEQDASLLERTLVLTLLHTGIRACELAVLKSSDIVQLQGTWKLHIHQGKGLKDRVLPLTAACLAALQAWQRKGWERTSEHLFSRYGQPWTSGDRIRGIIRDLGRKVGVSGLTPHRFRHTFAVALINYGMRESALQKLLGHATLEMTLAYGRILDQTVEHAFNQAVEQMEGGARSWVPNFFKPEEYTVFAEGDTVGWIKLPLGFCRRNPKLHCESDVKCLLCERFRASQADLPRLRDMHTRFVSLRLQVKADVVAAQIRLLETQGGDSFIPLEAISAGPTLRELPPKCVDASTQTP